jgi:hypothetical protein
MSSSDRRAGKVSGSRRRLPTGQPLMHPVHVGEHGAIRQRDGRAAVGGSGVEHGTRVEPEDPADDVGGGLESPLK